MAVPAATPRDIAQRLNDLINEALAQPDVKARLDEFGLSLRQGRKVGELKPDATNRQDLVSLIVGAEG